MFDKLWKIKSAGFDFTATFNEYAKCACVQMVLVNIKGIGQKVFHFFTVQDCRKCEEQLSCQPSKEIAI